MKPIKAEYRWEKETKRYHVFQPVDKDGPLPYGLYVEKGGLPDEAPEVIEVSITVK